MSDICYNVKRAKSITVLLIVLCSFTEMLFGGLIVFEIISIAKNEYKTFNNPTEYLGGNIFVLCFSFIVFIAILSVCIYQVREAKIQVDVYTVDKMYRKRGEKIIFELRYQEIQSIKEGYFAFLYTFFIFCSEPIEMKNGKKRPKTIMEHYTQKDISRIKEILLKSTNFKITN